MTTWAPSRARRRAMPRPMRLAAPVTRMMRPERSDRWFAMHLHLFRLAALTRRFRQLTRNVRPAPPDRRRRTERAGDAADQAGVVLLRCHSRKRHRHHHDTPLHGFDGRKHAA